MTRKRKATNGEYDPQWVAPTGDTQCLVRLQPGERTCLACGDTFAAGGYCIHCGESHVGRPSVATAAYLRPEEYMVVRL